MWDRIAIRISAVQRGSHIFFKIYEDFLTERKWSIEFNALLALNQAAAGQIYQMRKDISRCSGQQSWVNIRIDFLRQFRRRGRALGEGLLDVCFTALAMGNEPIYARVWICDGRAVAGIKDAPISGGQQSARGHEIGKIAIGR